MTGPTTRFTELLDGLPFALDGGLASELEARGHDLRHRLWSARVLADDPDAVRAVHLAYFRAGARVAVSASYQASRSGFVASGRTAAAADDALRRSVALAREARDAALAEGAPGPLLVAASVGPYGATLHDGSEYRGRYGVPHAQLVAFHAERIAVLAAAEPDLLAVETIPDVNEAAALVEVLAAYPELPAWLSFSAADGGHTCAGQPFTEAVTVAASAPTVLAVGVNCTDPRYVESLLRTARSATSKHLVTYPNAGGRYDQATATWSQAGIVPSAALVRSWAEAGAVGVGGCCGLGPDAVRAISAALGAPTR
jgi:homocysteine S-methyltransferase